MARLDMDEATDEELAVLQLGPEDFDALWQTGVLQDLNERLDILIDDYEDESVRGSISCGLRTASSRIAWKRSRVRRFSESSEHCSGSR